jgi:hypothetical protein
MRPALDGLPRYIVTVETTKHRVFQFVDASFVPDHVLVAIGSDDAFHLGVLSSRVHATWALRAGGWLGVGNDPRYSKSRCFDPFPFPDANPIQQHTIRTIAEELDAHRKRVLAEHGHLTLTKLYNVLETLRARPGEPTADSRPPPEATHSLTADERRVFDDGLVLILGELHVRLDAAVAAAYGWPADLADEELLARLVQLNRTRREEEARGEIRWLRPAYQARRFGRPADRQAAAEAGAQLGAALVVASRKPAFPTEAVEQTAALFAALAQASGPIDVATLAAGFRKSAALQGRIAAVLASLARLGYVTSVDGRAFLLRRVA